jgi:hypothetical protein
MAAKGRSLGGLPRPLANLRLWAPLLVVAIAVGAISAAAQAGVPAVASVPENSPLGLARNPAPTPVGVERLQAPESLLESAFGYGQSASGSPFSTRGPTTSEITTKEAEREFRTNPDFRDYVHKNYKPDVVTPDGKTQNPDLTPEQIKEAWDEWDADGQPKRK